MLERGVIVVVQGDRQFHEHAAARSSGNRIVNPHTHGKPAARLGRGSGGNAHSDDSDEHPVELHDALARLNSGFRERSKRIPQPVPTELR